MFTRFFVCALLSVIPPSVLADLAIFQASAQTQVQALKLAAEAMGLSVLALVAITVGFFLIAGYLLVGKVVNTTRNLFCGRD